MEYFADSFIFSEEGDLEIVVEPDEAIPRDMGCGSVVECRGRLYGVGNFETIDDEEEWKYNYDWMFNYYLKGRAFFFDGDAFDFFE